MDYLTWAFFNLRNNSNSTLVLWRIWKTQTVHLAGVHCHYLFFCLTASLRDGLVINCFPEGCALSSLQRGGCIMDAAHLSYFISCTTPGLVWPGNRLRSSITDTISDHWKPLDWTCRLIHLVTVCFLSILLPLKLPRTFIQFVVIDCFSNLRQ